MLRTLALLVPALVPSWRFFDVIAASPRIEVMDGADGAAPEWRAFRPRPRRVLPGAMLRRLFWNSAWNETLFLVTCAERLLDASADHGADHDVEEIGSRIAAGLEPSARGRSFRFRLVLVGREGEALHREVAYVSPPRHVPPA